MSKNSMRALLVAAFFSLLLSACSGDDGEEDAPAAASQESAETVELAALEIREGDGLPDSLPPGLVWETNDEDPVFAAPEAKRGGTLRLSMLAFPLTLRLVGPDSNGSFAGFMRANQLSPVSFHPETRRPIPSLATHWAFGDDERTLYYKLDPKARWSDGVPVTADDYIFAMQFMRSKDIVAPWYNNYYMERVRAVKRYDDYTIGIQGADPKPKDEMHTNYAFGPVPKHFHQLSKDWVRDYNWRIEPNTGPYLISEVKKGKYIVATRKADWWANDLKYYRHRFNPDKIRYRVIRDLTIAYQHFEKGELDTFGLVLPEYWHHKATGELFDLGYVGKYWYYNQLPVPSAGMYLNTADPMLGDESIRFGLAHSMNIDRVITTILRNDYERLPTFQLGFGEYDNREIKARAFDLEQADAYFDASGFVQRGDDGIRVNGDRRLSFEVTYGSPHHTERLVILKEEATKAGVELVLRLMDPSTAFKKMQEKKHQIAWMTWSSAGVAPRYWEHFHSANANKTQTNNLANYVNPEMDELILRYRASSLKEERVALAHQLEQMVHDSGVVIPTFQVPYTREGAWRWMKLPQWLGTRTTGALFNSQELSGGMYSSGGLFWIDTEEKAATLEARKEGRGFDPITLKNTKYRDE